MHSKAQPGVLQNLSEAMAPATVLVPEVATAVQKTLDELIDRGDISTRDLDTAQWMLWKVSSLCSAAACALLQTLLCVFTSLLSCNLYLTGYADLAHDLGDSAALAQ